MTAGLHMKADIIRINYSSDDDIGGAIVTGTVAYSSMPSVLSPRRPSQASQEAGLETDDLYDFTCRAIIKGDNVIIYERDEILVTWPPSHALYNLRFRVTGVQPPKGRTRYGAIHCSLSRIVTSRARQ